MSYPNISKFIDNEFQILTGWSRYGSGLLVVLGQDLEALEIMTDTISDGDDGAIYMDCFLMRIAKWYPLAFGLNFCDAMSNLEQTLVRVSPYSDSVSYHNAVVEVQDQVLAWSAQRRDGSQRVETFRRFKGFVLPTLSVENT